MDSLDYSQCINYLNQISRIQPAKEDAEKFTKDIEIFAVKLFELINDMYGNAASEHQIKACLESDMRILSAAIKSAIEGVAQSCGIGVALAHPDYQPQKISLNNSIELLARGMRILEKQQSLVQAAQETVNSVEPTPHKPNGSLFEQAVRDLDKLAPDLDFFSRLPPNTDVHLARHGHFIPNGGSQSGIPFAQSLANIWKGHSLETLKDQMLNFCLKLEKNLEAIRDSALESDCKEKAHVEIVLAHRAIQRALAGAEESGGMRGLLKTYETGSKSDLALLRIIFNNLETKADKILESSKAWAPRQAQNTIPLCPHEIFTDEDWEKAIKGSAELRLERVDLIKYYGLYTTALLFTQCNVTVGKWNWWDKIIEFDTGASMYLGALPFSRRYIFAEQLNDVEQLQRLKIGAVLSCVEVFENNSEGIVGSPATPIQWKDADIKQLQLPTPDFKSIPLDLLEFGVEFINWNIKNGRSVYVHCKAGRGRSALVEMCYLIKHWSYSAEGAFALIRERRIQAGFKHTSTKMKTLYEYENLYKNAR